jgi:purine-binding chemotaxis protein CheW
MIDEQLFVSLALDDDRDVVHEPMERLITFYLGSECYGVEVSRVREILRINQIFPVPGAIDCVAGITNIRGSVVTIIDGRRRLKLPPAEITKLSRMIVLEAGDEVAALVVDRVSNVIDVPSSAIEMRPGLKSRDDSQFVGGVVSRPNKLIILLNVDRLITDDDYGMAAGF